jgi:hypothetical protein
MQGTKYNLMSRTVKPTHTNDNTAIQSNCNILTNVTKLQKKMYHDELISKSKNKQKLHGNL